MNQVKAKFQCDEATHYPQYNQELQRYEPGGAISVKLSAVYGGTKNSEDNQFSTATPSGEIRMQIDNPLTKDFIQPGKKYYVYFEECPDQGA